ncbi:Disease resistance protein RPS5 [Vitis vinifera]|uniref:Disease resistance protein RPS5 n=1 Tax=Vitis vinifera TaxID=29760 RepID=A0A438CZS9_VITVI|nr:Disease resistance protein RPS5 [Vitis vinifera]
MDFVSPILDVVSRLYACTAKHADYIFHLKRNLESLRNKMVELKNLSEDVKARVELAERQNMRVRGVVKGWLERVDFVEVEVDLIMQQGDLEVEKKCLGSCCPKNFWAPCARVAEMPLGYTVGEDWLYEKVCSCLIEDKVGIIGLYGTGGVGKTTLMKKINNEFLKTKHQFGVVIWVSVSKQASVRTTQEVIRNKLQIPDGMWQGRTEDERAREIFNILKAKRFVLLLDNVWQRLDLSEIGVPPLPDDQYKSKVIITTRFMRICSDMEVQATFKVNCLTREEALALFLKKVGEDTLSSHPDIPNLAEMMTERCKGLPLALVTVGRAMANRITPQEWEQAIQELEKFPSEISGMDDQLFNVLKLSYDSLRDDITKSCFVYFSVFPKEYEIRNDELIEHWIGERFFDDLDICEARRRGHKIIEELKNASLLEERDGFKESIKIHDVIHDMALWIGHECGTRMNKILVCESVGFVEARRAANWNEAERISLWGRNIEQLPETPHCSKLLTLFVRECTELKTFPSGFFQFMPLIRVLNLSATHRLTEFPVGVERLINLEYLNLSMTCIKQLPTEIRNLAKLRCLLLDSMHALIIPPNVISSLLSLQLFSMYDGNALSAYRQALLEELESIERLDELSLSFRNIVPLNRLLSSHKLQRCMKRLSLNDCENLPSLKLSSVSLSYLETLVIFNCLQLEDVEINVEKEGRKGFDERTYDIPNPDLIVRNKQYFGKLRDVKIWSCPKLLNLTWLIYAAGLESLSIQSCESMKEVISYEEHLSGDPTLPALEVISVINCPKLGRLPFGANSADKSLKKIEGDTTWWYGLQWEDETIELTFTKYFSHSTWPMQSMSQKVRPHGTEKKGGKRVSLDVRDLSTARGGQTEEAKNGTLIQTDSQIHNRYTLSYDTTAWIMHLQQVSKL